MKIPFPATQAGSFGFYKSRSLVLDKSESRSLASALSGARVAVFPEFATILENLRSA